MSTSRPLALAALAVGAALATMLLPPVLAATIAFLAVIAGALLARDRAQPAIRVETAREIEVSDLDPLIQRSSEGVFLLDAEHRVLAANAAAARIVGRPPDSLTGVSLIQAVRSHDLAEVARHADAPPSSIHLSGPGADVIATASTVASGPVRVVLLIQDVTELLRAQRARTDLVANVSHELRTPIAAARALAETLEAGVDEPEERQRFLRRLVEELERLGNIVQRLLWLSRVESGAEPFALETLDSTALMTEAASRIGPVAQAHAVRIEVDASGGEVVADSGRVLEVLSNLLDNAVQHSPAGAVVRLTSRPDASFVRFEVSDRGAGILPQDRERVFERFYTGDRSRASGGSGLGLAIARRIVQRLGGQIWIADGTGPGATVCFTLPAANGFDEVSASSD